MDKQWNVLDRLACSLGRRDEQPNIALAEEIVQRQDKKAVQELVNHLTGKSKDVQSDCIKVLYEIGKRQPALIAGFTAALSPLLDSKNNRLQWGAMMALNSIAQEKPAEIYAMLPKLAAVADAGSVITKDNYVAILIKLMASKKFPAEVFHLLNEQLLNSPPNQLPMYAENALPVIDDRYKPVFIQTLTARLDELQKESQRKRVEKILKKLRAK